MQLDRFDAAGARLLVEMESTGLAAAGHRVEEEDGMPRPRRLGKLDGGTEGGTGGEDGSDGRDEDRKVEAQRAFQGHEQDRRGDRRPGGPRGDQPPDPFVAQGESGGPDGDQEAGEDDQSARKSPEGRRDRQGESAEPEGDRDERRHAPRAHVGTLVGGCPVSRPTWRSARRSRPR